MKPKSQDPKPIPCPYCGYEQEKGLFIRNDITQRAAVKCDNCGATGPEMTTKYDTQEGVSWHGDAIKKWNIRSVKGSEFQKNKQIGNCERCGGAKVVPSGNDDEFIICPDCNDIGLKANLKIIRRK